MEDVRWGLFALAVAMGVGTYIGLLHFWMWSRREGGAPHAWVGLFCLGSLLFQVARCVQLTALDPAWVLIGGRGQVASAPLLIFSLVGFARSLSARPWSGLLLAGFGAINAALVVLALETPVFVPSTGGVHYDWFGDPFLGTPASPATGLLFAYIVVSFLYISYEVARSPELAREERRALMASLGLYCAAGALSVLGAMKLVSFPVSTQYGPLVVALGLSYMLLHRHQRLRVALEQTAEDNAAALGASEARYRTLVDGAPIGLVACREDGRLVAVNRRMLDMLGAPADAALSESGRINILPSDASDAPSILGSRIAQALRRCIATGESMTDEVSMESRWGKQLDLRLTVAVVRDGGRVTGAQAIAEDVSDRKKLENQLRQWQKMEAVGHLAAGIAHEINNPMAYVRTNLKMLREEWSELVESGMKLIPNGPPQELTARADECEELIDESLEGVDRTIAIVRDVKEFAHTGEARTLPLDLNEVVDSAVRMASARLPTRIRVETSYAELPAVMGSSGQLQQVFLNLLMNAIHAVGDEGLICVSTWAEPNEVIVAVSDTGCGISDEVLEHLFDPFFTTKPIGEGTGLGLYISYEIVRAHGGDVRVQSAAGEGSRFEVRLSRSAK